jgi:hypothetical protein
MSARSERPVDIPALTGLRFIAALSVVLAHGLNAMTAAPGVEPFWRTWLTYSSAFGMSAFFVLSGFVIHYNYSDSIVEYRWRGAANFFSARFARLYPLYAVCIVFSLYDHGYFFSLVSGNHQDVEDQFFQLFPYYSTMTQSWKYSVVGSNALIYGYPFSNIAAISWSISTETFFYVCYPLVCIALLGLRTSRQIVTAGALVAAIALGLMFFAYRHTEAIDQFGIAHFGPIAGLAHGTQDSFFRWVVYFAPYSRLFEFILGCLIAALYRHLAARDPSAREERLGFVLAGLSILLIGGMMWVMARPSNPAPFLQFLHMNFGFALPVGSLIFCAARYRNAISAALSHRLMVRCGEASYSIYLLHAVVLEGAGLKVPEVGLSGAMTSVIVLRLGIAMLVIISFSLVTYRLVEVPARRWLRRILTIETRPRVVASAPSLTGQI